jgi:hypothetical protein
MGILLAPIPNMLLPFSIMAPPPQGSILEIFLFYTLQTEVGVQLEVVVTLPRILKFIKY